MPIIEYSVRPVTRYVVTRYERWNADEDPAGVAAGSCVRQIGEYMEGTGADLVADGLIALDKSKGIESTRRREGLSLGEVISGKRIE